MFQDTLLIIKCDYLHKRKALLIFLLQQGFQIQGQRKLLFTPELAAEFLEDLSDDSCFMFQVILLSKGNSEAFILAKECAVEDLFNLMVCHFGTSVEMERNVHVTKCQTKVGREISFIFPNYIHEPINWPDQTKFCVNNPLVSSLISQLYDIVIKTENEPHKGWKEKLAEWLVLSNKSLPHVSNQCCQNPNLQLEEIAQQTRITCFKNENQTGFETTRKSSLTDGINFDTDGSSLNITSSSCISCSGFGSADECRQQLYTPPLEDIIKAKMASLNINESLSSLERNTAQENISAELLAEDKTGEDEEVEFVTSEGPLTLKGGHVYEESITVIDVGESDYIVASNNPTDNEEQSKSEEKNTTELEPLQTIVPIIFDEYEPANTSEGSSIKEEEYVPVPSAEDDEIEEDSPATEDVAPTVE